MFKLCQSRGRFSQYVGTVPCFRIGLSNFIHTLETEINRDQSNYFYRIEKVKRLIAMIVVTLFSEHIVPSMAP